MPETIPMKKNKKGSPTPSCIKTASFYGFLPAADYIKDFTISKGDRAKAKTEAPKDNSLQTLEEKIALTRLFIEKKMLELPQPIMIFYKSPMNEASGIPASFSPKHHSFNLDIIGNPKSIADAMLIETSYVIAKEEYTGCEITVELNSVGDRESIARLQRELRSFYRKHASKIPTALKASYRKNIFESFRTDDKKAIALREMGPNPIDCLSEGSRKHFKEVLEYIESLAIPYTIQPALIGNLSYGGETAFEITATDKKGAKKIVARGQRYNGVARKFWNKKEVSSIGVSIFLKHDLIECKDNVKHKAHKLFFIQLGFEAKLKSLQLLETLRKAKIDVYQSLSKDRMTTQIALAEKMAIPYIIIMGKKEAMEHSVVVRHMATRRQDNVDIDKLVDYVKKLK